MHKADGVETAGTQQNTMYDTKALKHAGRLCHTTTSQDATIFSG